MNMKAGASSIGDDVDKSEALQYILHRLRPFQMKAYQFAMEKYDRHRERVRLLIADEMGLGKTITALAIMTRFMDDSWPLLILCPASLRHTWPSEIEKFIPSLPFSSVYVISGFDDIGFVKRKGVKIIVATYSILQKRAVVAKALQEFGFRCVIADESHNLKEKSSQRCELAMPILKCADHLLLLSGTPALARPVELWAQLHCIDENNFGSYTFFTKQYCNARQGRFGWDVSGVSNIQELNEKLSPFMVRRLKSDVLDELPSKQRSIVPITVCKGNQVNECIKILEDLKSTRANIDDLIGEAAREAHFEARRLLMSAYQASGIAKAPMVAEYVTDWLSGSGLQKLLVFAHHKEVLDTIENAVAKKMKGIGHIRIDGSSTSADRAASVRKFQNQQGVRVALLSVTAAGVGLTLTAASTVIFAELHWTPGILVQAEDRCHRIGQKNAVNVIYCIDKDESRSIDSVLWKMLSKKMNNISEIIDGKKNFMNANSLAVNNSDPNTKIKSGVQRHSKSGEEELIDFFAESKCSTSKTTPVKGSIQSFFGKKKKTPDMKPNIVTPSVWRCTYCTFDNVNSSNKCSICGNNQNHSQIKHKQLSSEKRYAFGQPIKSIISEKETLTIPTWACKKCTFVNTGHLLGERTCEMCGSKELSEKLTDAQAEKNTNQAQILFSESKPRSRDAIDLTDDIGHILCDSKPCCKLTTSKALVRDANERNILKFSVSANSGRVAVYLSTGVSLNFNFDLHELSSRYDQNETCRVTKRLTCIQENKIKIDQKAIYTVVSRMNKNIFLKNRINFNVDSIVNELNAFVCDYINLRDVEKKVLKDSNIQIHPFSVHVTVAKLMGSSVRGVKERFGGGAKERARVKLKNGDAEQVDKDVLAKHACAWCGGALSNLSFHSDVTSTYCSRECTEEGRLRRGKSSQIRQQLFALERGICCLCGIDAYAFFLRVKSLQPAERLNALCNTNWKLPKNMHALERLLHSPKEGDFWQADHIIPVVEGGGDCSLDNLRTLCTPCHQNETLLLHHRLRLKSQDDPSQKTLKDSFISGSITRNQKRKSAD